jgi:hypothetical protein
MLAHSSLKTPFPAMMTHDGCPVPSSKKNLYGKGFSGVSRPVRCIDFSRINYARKFFIFFLNEQSGCHNGTFLGFCSFRKNETSLHGYWTKSMRLTGLEIPE